MVNKLGYIDNIPLYTDPYLEKDKILKGRKQGSDKIFILANPETANIMYQGYIRRLRKEKLKRLNATQY